MKISLKEIILWLIVFVSFLYLSNEVLKSHERIKCIQWRQQEEMHEGFYWTDWQVEQCKHFPE
jgi:hypothetical protein